MRTSLDTSSLFCTFQKPSWLSICRSQRGKCLIWASHVELSCHCRFIWNFRLILLPVTRAVAFSLILGGNFDDLVENGKLVTFSVSISINHLNPLVCLRFWLVVVAILTVTLSVLWIVIFRLWLLTLALTVFFRVSGVEFLIQICFNLQALQSLLLCSACHFLFLLAIMKGIFGLVNWILLFAPTHVITTILGSGTSCKWGSCLSI